MNTAAAVPVQIIKAVVGRFPAVVPLMDERARAVLKAQASYEGIRATWWLVVFDAVNDYLTSDRPVTSFANAMKRGVAEAFFPAAEIAYVEAGADLPMDEDTTAWLVSEQNAELAHIDDLFARLKAEWEGIDPENEALARAEAYASRLDGIYNEALLRGSKNITAVWRLGATEKHCKTCASLDGQSHRISWYIDHDYIPRKSGCALDCGGWNCDCRLETKNGEEITL